MANADYMAVFNKHKATIYDATTTMIIALAHPIVVAPWCQTTGLWKLDLDAAVQVGGPQEKMPFFQIAPGPFRSS